MKSLTSVVAHSHVGSQGSRQAMVRFLGAAPAALLLSSLLLVAAVPMIASVAAMGTPSGDWTQFHNGPTHVGYNTQETILSASNAQTLGLAWTGATGFYVDSSPAVANGVVYVGSADGKLYAYAAGCASDGGTCKPLWTGITGVAGGIASSPAVAGGVVYVGNDFGNLYAFAANGVTGCSGSPKTCSPLWTAATGSSIKSPPTVASGVVYVGSEDHKLYAYAVGCNSGGGTCTPLWTATTGGMILGSPAYSNSKVYVGSMDGKLYAFDATGVTGCSGVVPNKTCLPLWTAASGSIQNSSPAVAGGVVYVGSDDFELYAFDATGVTGCSGVLPNKTCTPLWHGVTGSWVVSSPAVANGVVYVGSADHKLYAYAVGCSSGGGFCSPLWTATTGNEVNSSPAVANGVVYVGSEDHKLYAFAANGGTACTGSFPLKTCPPLWTATTGGMIDSSPAVTNGVVYVGSEDYKLYAYALSAATTLVVSGIANPYVAGAAHSVTVTAKDVHGHVAGGYRGTVHFTSTDAKAVLPANYTFTGADAGVHKFALGLILKTAGTRSVTATDTVTASIKGTQTGIVVTPAAATHLTVSGIANPYVAGVAHSVTVTAKDAYGNTATGYHGIVHFTSSDPAAVLPANYTFTAADAGIHKFALGVTLKTAGTQWVRATDTVTATITGLESGIVVS